MEEGTNVFTIKDLEDLSGIKAHTIRIWEKRYRILEPDRTESNIRSYSETELKKILNVAYLNRNGLKISKIAKLSEDELTARVMTISSRHETGENSLGKILKSGISFNEYQLREAVDPFVRKYGLEEAYLKYLHPLLEKARLLWQTGGFSRAQEQFVRNVIRQILILEDISLKAPAVKPKASVAMINTSDNLSENNFLFYKYLLRKRGFDTIFTGGILPASEVIEIYKIKHFEYLIANSYSFDFSKKKISYFSSIGKSLLIRKIIFTDYPVSDEKRVPGNIRIPVNIIITRNPEEFRTAVDSLK